VCAKSLRQLVLTRTDEENVGFMTEPELGEGREDELRVFIADVQLQGPADRCGQTAFIDSPTILCFLLFIGFSFNFFSLIFSVLDHSL